MDGSLTFVASSLLSFDLASVLLKLVLEFERGVHKVNGSASFYKSRLEVRVNPKPHGLIVMKKCNNTRLKSVLGAWRNI